MPKLAKYELLAKIASGGMAEIHVARMRAAGRSQVCVVKKLLPQHTGNDEFVQMFLDEGRIGALFNHPNIVRVFDQGIEDGSHYLAMEYLHGEDMRTVLRTLKAAERGLPRSLAVGVISAVCAGLHHAHETRGANGDPLEIVHRDISPHNVFLTFDGSVKVVDFGIAKSTDRDWETKHGTIKGKVPYMSPEQIKGRPVDRRSDLYAVGVMLYELTLGRRPYVLATSGDFAVMMAIARHDVRPPREIDPNIPPELERIILKALAYDRKERYQTALDMQNDLDAFAEKSGFPPALTERIAFLEGLFESQVEKWRAVDTGAGDLAAHAVEVEEARAQSGMFEEDEPDLPTEIDASELHSNGLRAPMPPGSAASLVASTSAAIASVVEIFGVTVVTLQGRIDEQFDGKALGGSLSGTVLFDMAGVERITSFGVREWLEMMGALGEDVDAYLARCPEPIVTQLSVVRTFAGKAKVVSFDVPFLCDDCGNTFARTIDCAHDRALITAPTPPVTACPRCGGEAKLDDDRSYLAFAERYAGLEVPDRLRAVLERLDAGVKGGADAVDKIITSTETRVRVHRDVDPAFRWNRVLDGIEGNLVIDFRGASRFGREAAKKLVRALGPLGRDVTSCELVECPVEVALAVGEIKPGAHVKVGSMAFEGRCNACAAARTGGVGLKALREAYEKRSPLYVPCRRCNAALAIDDPTPVLTALFGASAPDVARPVVAAPPSSPTPSAVVKPAPAPPTRRPTAPIFVGLAGAAVIGLVLGAVALARRQGDHPPVAAAMPSFAPSAGPVSPAPRESLAFEQRPDGVYVSVLASAASEDLALEAARTDAIAKLVARMEPELTPAVRAANAVLPVSDPAQTAAAFVAEVGAFASPDRIDVQRQSGALRVGYRIADAAWKRAVAFYSETKVIGGLTVAVALPSRGRGLVVVDDPGRTISTGALLSALDGHEIMSLDGVAPGRHNATVIVHGERAVRPLTIK